MSRQSSQLIKEYLKFLNRVIIFTTKCNDSLISIRIISWDYLISSLTNDYVGDVTIPTQVIKQNNFFQADQPIRLQYSHQIKLFLVNTIFNDPLQQHRKSIMTGSTSMAVATTLPEQLNSLSLLRFQWDLCCSIFSLSVCCRLQPVVFPLFILAIVLSIISRLTYSDYPFWNLQIVIKLFHFGEYVHQDSAQVLLGC